MNAILESQIAAALGRNRTPADSGRDRSGIAPETNRSEARSTWAQDYGPRNETTARAALDASRLPNGIGWHSDGSGSASGKDRLDDRRSWSAKTLWRAMSQSLCNGTRFFAVCAGIVAFIVVV